MGTMEMVIDVFGATFIGRVMETFIDSVTVASTVMLTEEGTVMDTLVDAVIDADISTAMDTVFHKVTSTWSGLN